MRVKLMHARAARVRIIKRIIRVRVAPQKMPMLRKMD
jgi:hypothetical protein